MNAIDLPSGRKVLLDLTENVENGGGGDIWADSKITLYLLKDNERIELELDASREFRFPQNIGNYVLVVEYVNPSGKAQYVGNVIIH